MSEKVVSADVPREGEAVMTLLCTEEWKEEEKVKEKKRENQGLGEEVGLKISMQPIRDISSKWEEKKQRKDLMTQ